MIACDNDLCPIEWYHYECVEIKSKPEGNWYCPMCRADNDTETEMRPIEEFSNILENYNEEADKEWMAAGGWCKSGN